MKQLIISIVATMAFVTLIIYDFLSICRIIKKEAVVEKLWEQLIPTKPYNEIILFVGIRPMFLTVSFLCFILSGGVLERIIVYKVLLYITPLLALGSSIRNHQK